MSHFRILSTEPKLLAHRLSLHYYTHHNHPQNKYITEITILAVAACDEQTVKPKQYARAEHKPNRNRKNLLQYCRLLYFVWEPQSFILTTEFITDFAKDSTEILKGFDDVTPRLSRPCMKRARDQNFHPITRDSGQRDGKELHTSISYEVKACCCFEHFSHASDDPERTCLNALKEK